MGVKEDVLKEVLDNFLTKFNTNFESFLFHKKEENYLSKEFSNLKLNKENNSLQTLKKNMSSDESNKSFENNGFLGYLRSYTLSVDPEINNIKINNLNKAYDGRRPTNILNNPNPNTMRPGSSLNGFNGYSRNFEEILPTNQNNANFKNFSSSTQYILKDAENKLNIYNNGYKNYFQEKSNNSYSDISSLTKKIDDIYGKIFTTNHALPKKY